MEIREKPQKPYYVFKIIPIRLCIGLSEKFDESKRILETENNITALVRTTKSEIDDFLKGEKIGKSDIDALCAMRGIETGKNVEICKGIHAESVSENLRLQ